MNIILRNAKGHHRQTVTAHLQDLNYCPSRNGGQYSDMYSFACEIFVFQDLERLWSIVMGQHFNNEWSCNAHHLLGVPKLWFHDVPRGTPPIVD